MALAKCTRVNGDTWAVSDPVPRGYVSMGKLYGDKSVNHVFFEYAKCYWSAFFSRVMYRETYAQKVQGQESNGECSL